MAKLEFGLGQAIEAARKKKAKLILLQFPEGLKPKIGEIAKEIEEKTGAKTITIVRPCYGACDIPLQEMKALKADLVVHFGHTRMLEAKNIIYVPLQYRVSKSALEKLTAELSKKLRGLGLKNPGIVATAQYLGHLGTVKKALGRNGFKATIAGQVLGCDASAAEGIKGRVDCFVFVGDGRFHPLGIANATGKPVFLLNALNNSVGEIPGKEADRMERAHIARVAVAGHAKSYGILLSAKPGQMDLARALKLKKMAEKKGKSAIILASGELKEEFVLGLGVECFVNTACPRLVLDDSKHWAKPLISAEEMESALACAE